MKITIQYTGQLSNLAGRSEETADLPEDASLKTLVDQLKTKHEPDFIDLLLDSDGELRPSILVIFDGEQADGKSEVLQLAGVKTVMLMAPIAGG